MPIMSIALGELGLSVNCLGAMGFPETRSEFSPMERSNFNLYNLSELEITNALEFEDGKIMLAEMSKLEKITWGHIKNTIGLSKIKEFTIYHWIIILQCLMKEESMA